MDDHYAEYAPSPDVARFVRCTWSRATAGARATITPDGCVDIVVAADGRTSIAGPDTSPKVANLAFGVVVGLRFQIGAAGAVLGFPASALRDLRVPLSEVWRDDAARLEEALSRLGSVHDRRAALESVVRRRTRRVDHVDSLVLAAARRLEHGSVASELRGAFGVGDRQLLRRFDAAVGYGPKVLERVLRFRRMLDALRAQEASELATLAHAMGYADQAHMTRECRRLAGETPRALGGRAKAATLREGSAESYLSLP